MHNRLGRPVRLHDYEEKVFPMDKPDPVAAIRFRMEQQGLEPKDLVPLLGGRSRVSEVLSGRRNLSLKMIRNLVQHLGIPAEVSSASPEPQILALSALLLPINAEIWFCALNRGANRT